jgi:hypothetical protein
MILRYDSNNFWAWKETFDLFVIILFTGLKEASKDGASRGVSSWDFLT